MIIRGTCAAGEALGIDTKPNFRRAQGETLATLWGKGQNEEASDPRGRRVAACRRGFWAISGLSAYFFKLMWGLGNVA